ncbi:MAG: pyridoxal phosphate-dependent aminotransferase [Rhizobacter sp.]|nr:pyridoxal phosphate-dependent aminotransferase [Bacteriovorax sp.]
MVTTSAFGLKNPSENIKGNLFQNPDLKKKINMTLGEPRLSEFPYELFDELKKIDKINNYYSSLGDEELRAKIIEKYYSKLSLDNIAITHGAIGALDIIFRANVKAGDEVMLPDPGFPPYEKLAIFSGARVEKYEINFHDDETLINWKSLYAHVSKKTKIILINSPHNPTGKIFTEKDLYFLKGLLDFYPELIFIMDEVYRDLIYTQQDHLDLSCLINRGYIVNSFSKIYPLQGARIGWTLTNKENINKITPYLNNAFGAISSFGQELAKLLLKRNPDYLEKYKEARTFSCSILDFYGVDYIIPSGALFIFINYGLPDLEMVQQLDTLGILAVSGAAFGKLSAGYVRFSFAQEISHLKEAFHIIGRHWSEKNSGIIKC